MIDFLTITGMATIVALALLGLATIVGAMIIAAGDRQYHPCPLCGKVHRVEEQEAKQ